MSYLALIERLSNPAKAERASAVAELRAALPDSRDAVLAAMSSPRWEVRASAAAVLDHAEQDAVVERVLVLASSDHDARVRQSALHSLACAHCKPEGCVQPGSLELLVDALLHDPSIRLRRKLAGELMWGQHGRGETVVLAFRHVLDVDTDRVLRDRAAQFLAACDVPRSSMPYREWIGAWRRRIDELLSERAPTQGDPRP
jgi:HEAT repeat protein